MRTLVLPAFVVLSMVSAGQKGVPGGSQSDRLKIAGQMDSSIKTELLNKWYPASVDTNFGGFLSTWTYDFKPTGPQEKFIVTQARHTWTTAKAASYDPSKPYYIQCATHGFRFLRDVMWDKDLGGFYNLVTREGIDKSNPEAPKEAYGNAFGIYALAAYYKASGDTAALALAQKAFLWLEEHSHDPIHKGYYQHLKRDGTPVQRGPEAATTSDRGYKDMNSSIHLMEAFTELYSVWKDDLLRQRLQELLYLVRDHMVTNKGYVQLFFRADWSPVSFRDSSKAVILKHRYLDHVSFGHDIEIAYLMLEAAKTLGLEGDKRTLEVGKKLVDHALRNGWDKSLGGFYDEGYYFKGEPRLSIIKASKNWWTQAEGLNTLLLMADRFPGDPMRYYDKFRQLWEYIQVYMIDHQHGDWYEEGLDKEPQRRTALKGHIWKGTYHHFRALSNCVRRLRGEAE